MEISRGFVSLPTTTACEYIYTYNVIRSSLKVRFLMCGVYIFLCHLLLTYMLRRLYIKLESLNAFSSPGGLHCKFRERFRGKYRHTQSISWQAYREQCKIELIFILRFFETVAGEEKIDSHSSHSKYSKFSPAKLFFQVHTLYSINSI